MKPKQAVSKSFYSEFCVLFPESINTIQNNVKMATIFSPLLPPPGNNPLGHVN